MTNETHENRGTPDRMHELLCAYVLGETNADERREIEAALASSPELRAEKAHIESTIGFVKTALAGDETLSPRAREEVLSAALPRVSVPRPWWRETWARAAASILFVSFALGGWSIYETKQRAAVCDDVAQKSVNERGSGLDGLGYLGEGSATVARVEPSLAAATDQQKKSEFGLPRDAAEAKPQSANVPDVLVQRGDAGRAAGHRDAENDRGQVSDKSTVAVLKDAGESKKREAAEVVAEDLFQGRDGDEQLKRRLYDDEASSRLALQPAPPAPRGEESAKAGEHLEQERAVTGVELQTVGGAGGGSKDSPGRPLGPTTGSPAGPSTASASGPTTSAPGGKFAARSGALGKKSAATDTKEKSADAKPAGTAAVPKATERKTDRGTTATEELTDRLRAMGYVGEANDDEAPQQFQSVADPAANLLQDEDRFILEKLGMLPNAQNTSAITPDVRARYRDEYVADWCGRIVRHCRPLPNERPRDMFFRFWGDNAFEFAAVDALSTFSADVDTASYALARRYIEEGHLPVKDQIRTEEFVNYFKADVPAPTTGTFAIQTTLAPSRFGAAAPGELVALPRDLLRVVVRGKDMPKAERKPLALTFVVDCSGSMKEQNRMEMVKHAMRLLVNQLDARDSIAIVKFSTDATLVLPMTSAKEKALIESAIFPLAADGSTNSEAGLRMGYGAALSGLNREATNRVVFLSDGVANVGITDPNVISDAVKQIREQGIYLNTVGVGMNNHNDVLLEQLADKGDGVCNYVDTPAEAKKVFVDDFMSTVETIARDVKIQVEFDPAQVYRYRLLGYENRAVADADFRNDKVDAGEVGAGHQVTALYEIEYARVVNDEQLEMKLDGPRRIATVRVRYKAPRVPGAAVPNEEASEIHADVAGGQRTSWEGAGAGYRRATIVAQFAEFLRRSWHARSDSYDQMLADARKLAVEQPDAEFAQLVTLMEKAKALILNGWPNQTDDLALAIDKVRENQVLRAQLERVAQERDRAVLAELETQNRQLEERLREILRNRLERGR